MSKKFIPNGDSDFDSMARTFAGAIAKEPAKYDVAQDDSDALTAAVERYQAALQACRGGNNRSSIATRAKEDARGEAERIIRRLGHALRANPRLDAVAKMALGMMPRKEKPKVLPVPAEPPRVRFMRAIHEANGATPLHELSFGPLQWGTTARPPGAVRLELFVDLVAPDEPIPTWPGASHGGGAGMRAWYLRSYTRSPIKLVPPIANVPMRVIYWGRWADSMGNVGPFSATAVGWIEGGCGRSLPGGTGMRFGLNATQIPILEIESPPEEQKPRPQYHVAVLEARYAALNPTVNAGVIEQMRALPPQQIEEMGVRR